MRSVIVVDFFSHDGEPSTLGWYLADELSENWLAKKSRFRVLDRSELKDTRITAEDLSPDMIKRLGSVWGVDAIVTGIVESSPEQFTVSASVRRVADATVAATTSIIMPHSRILDILSPPPGKTAMVRQVTRAGVDGVGIPTCLSCPIPSYSDVARKAKVQGTILLSVTVSETGRAEAVSIVKALGFGLTERAIETVIDWRFKPATTAEGKAVAVTVPVEVTMRLY